MAKHRRRFRGFGMLPSLNTFKQDINGQDMLLGLGVGLAGVIAAKYAKSNITALQTLVAKLPVNVVALTPAIGGLVAGLIAFAAQKGSKQSIGHLLGATAFGLALSVDTLVKENLAKSTVATDGTTKSGTLSFYAGIEDFGALVPDTYSGYGRSGYGALQSDYRGYGALQADYSGYSDENEIERAIG